MQAALSALHSETLNGRPEGKDYTWFVQDRECICDVLDSLTAEQASRVLRDGVATIAAHCFHIHFALASGNAQCRGETFSGTWESSWHVQAVTDAEWAALGHKIKSEFADNIRHFSQKADWDDQDETLGTCALIPHMAFHLGAIRQLMKFL